jgi:hypothetical protein
LRGAAKKSVEAPSELFGVSPLRPKTKDLSPEK